MGRSLSLAAYRAFLSRAPVQHYVTDAARPPGDLVWAHAATSDRVGALASLRMRLTANCPGTQLLITFPSELKAGRTAHPGAGLCEPLPSDHIASVDRFFEHWRPDMGLWAGGDLRPNAIVAAAERKIPLALIDVDVDGFDGIQARWFPDLTRQLLSRFGSVAARSTRARQRLVRFGLAVDDIELTVGLQRDATPLPYPDSEVDKLASGLGGRPVWLAAHVQPDEVNLIIRAHRNLVRLAHRLLLIICPDDPAQGDAVARALREHELRYCRWGDGTTPDETMQVMVADTADELGLWYRIAPVSLIASSLTQGYGGHDPFDAVVLGSAVLYGPHVKNHLHAYGRLANAGAARIVNDADALRRGVAQLIVPDQAARMATAGWQVLSESAEVVDRIIDLVQATLDERVGA